MHNELSESSECAGADLPVILRSRNRECHVHVGHYCTTNERQIGYMNLYHDWWTWVREGLVDGVTTQDETVDSPHCHQVRELTRELGIPFYQRRRHWCTWPGEPWEHMERRIARQASDFGMDGMIFYENFWAIHQGEEPGTLDIIVPDIPDIVRELKR